MNDTKNIAKIPIIPDDINNKIFHKDHELLMDFIKNDIYVKKGNEYINITGKLKEIISQINEASIIYVVDEKNIPPLSERPENSWYFVVTSKNSI